MNKQNTPKPTLVTNKAEASPHASMVSLTVNFTPSLVRNDQMGGRQYLVVPMVILTEGVHSANLGPLLYPADELSEVPEIWNHKPIVVYHPEANGVPISGCDPDVITNRGVGIMMNTKFEKGRLKSEAWIEVDRANLIDERIIAAVNNNEMMEVSTGLFADYDMMEGEWKGETYAGIARNYRPDHLALLPDKIGACSIADGAGFLRNQSEANAGSASAVKSAVKSILNRLGLADNEFSHESPRRMLKSAIEKQNGFDAEKGPWVWIEDVYSNFFIYETSNKLYRRSYIAKEDGVELGTEPAVEVIRITEYRNAASTPITNSQPTKTSPTNMKKVQVIAAIIAANAGFTAADEEKLNAFDDAQLEQMHKAMTTPAPVAPAAKQEPVVNKTATPAEPLTVEAYISAAPSGFREVLQNSHTVYLKEKQDLVDSILANKEAGFTKEELNNRPLGELKKLAKLAGNKVETPSTQFQPNYSGAAELASNEGEEAMAMPVLSWK